ncbi:MAG: type II secretion system inner membrane protein GspF [Thermodesulfobacteriota bacterium]
MPVYEYKALDAKGKSITGIIDTESAGLARQKLRASNIFPTEIKELYAGAARKGGGRTALPGIFSRVSRTEMTMMTRQLSTLVGAGFPLVSALSTLVPQTKSQAFRKILSQIKDSIEGGNSFAGALSLYPETFSPIYINMVRAGESSGTLEIVLERLADIAEKQQSLNNKIKSVLAYPAVMSVVAAGVLFFLLAYIVPRITSIFTNIKQVLPLPTRMLLGISSALKTYWWLILVLAAGAVIITRLMHNNEKGRRMLDRFWLAVPIAGPLLRKLAVARFARTLGSLLENGVSMLVALEIVRNIVGNVIIAETVEMAAREVEKGHALGKAIETAETFPYLAIQMIQVGEQSGALETMLNKVADVFETETESSLVALTSLLEPIIILIMGVVVAFIVLSIIMPIIEMNQLIK